VTDRLYSHYRADTDVKRIKPKLTMKLNEMTNHSNLVVNIARDSVTVFYIRAVDSSRDSIIVTLFRPAT